MSLHLQVCLIIVCGSLIAVHAAIVPSENIRRTSEGKELKAQPRILWSPLGALLENFSILPITINVPDIIYGIGEILSGVYNYVFGGSASQSTPRPVLKYLLGLSSAFS